MRSKKSTLAGFFTGLFFWVVLLSLSLSHEVIMIVPTLPWPVSIALGLILLPGPTLLGWMAGAVTEKRFLKLFGASFALFLICALAAGNMLVFSENGGMYTTFLEKFGGGVALGSMGAALFGIPFLPLLALVVFFLERFTRPPVPMI